MTTNTTKVVEYGGKLYEEAPSREDFSCEGCAFAAQLNACAKPRAFAQAARETFGAGCMKHDVIYVEAAALSQAAGDAG